MEDYKKLCKELVEDYINDNYDENNNNRRELLEGLLEDTQNVFGNLDGSRTCSTYEAEQFINKANAVFDNEIIDLFSELGDDYMTETLKKGAETFDVVILELLSNRVISEMLENKVTV